MGAVEISNVRLPLASSFTFQCPRSCGSDAAASTQTWSRPTLHPRSSSSTQTGYVEKWWVKLFKSSLFLQTMLMQSIGLQADNHKIVHWQQLFSMNFNLNNAFRWDFAEMHALRRPTVSNNKRRYLGLLPVADPGGKFGHGPIQLGYRLALQRRNKREILGNRLNCLPAECLDPTQWFDPHAEYHWSILRIFPGSNSKWIHSSDKSLKCIKLRQK